MVVPQEEKPSPDINKRNGKNDEGWDFESPGNLIDKKTARWIEEQNEFLGKQEEKELEKGRKERDPPVFNRSGPIKVLQKQRANLRTGYEPTPQHPMGVQKGQALHPPLVMTNKGDASWRGPGRSARSFCSQFGGGCFCCFLLCYFFLQLCQRFLLLWLCSNVLRLLGNVVRVYPRIIQGLTFLSA